MNSSSEDNSNSGNIAAVQSILYIILLLTAIVGNGLFFFLYIRHKILRTVHHVLFADLSVIDSLNSIINIPLSICYVVFDTPSLRGKTFAWTVSFLHTFFALLSLASMALQMVDRYVAVCWPILYKTSKSIPQIIAVIFVKWLVILTLVLLVYVPLYDLDLGSSPVLRYRELYSKKSGQKLPLYVVSTFVLIILLFGGLTLRKLRKRPGEVAGAVHNARNSSNMKARKKAVLTILILLVIALISYLPLVIKTRLSLGLEQQAKNSLVFVIIFTLSVPSAVNPFIILIRVRRFSDRFKLLQNNLRPICCKDQTKVKTIAIFSISRYSTSCCGGAGNVLYRVSSCTDLASSQKLKTTKRRRTSI